MKPPIPTTDKMREAWPENIVADRHDLTGKWVLHYLTDEQAAIVNAALATKENDNG